ncbi:hypothetical protein [Candidatus Nitronereus thalassa]|uniref:DUF4292 domain-containing protein n=1 Tax=Candidatus Nitronereus thalassa TaxID=3020898 RepID=A0ABU3K4Q9_9BACT|nr:hypothetical protein [Candidatus Nitronereus thalassa]MDT7041371.1 hypothetical protein [Candidatus Nitronereus thalassa]
MGKISFPRFELAEHPSDAPIFPGFGCFLLCLILLSSCTTVPEPTPSSTPSLTSAQIIEILHAREAEVSSLKGLFHAEIDGQGMVFAHSLDGSIFYQRPDRFRIKGFTRFGGLVFDFALSGEFYALRVQDQPQPIFGGMDNFQGLGELRLPVLLSLRAAEVLLGKLPLPADGIESMQEGEDMYQIDLPPDQKTNTVSFSRRIMIDRDSLRVRQLEYLDSQGLPVASIQTSDFRRVRDRSPNESATILLPFDVKAEDRKEAGSITLEFREIIANEPLNERLFMLTNF